MRSVLVVLFNQDFSVNIPKLETLYEGRFSEIVYLVPDFYSRLHDAYRASAVPVRAIKSLDILASRTRRVLGMRNPHELAPAARRVLGDRFRRVVGDQYYFYDFLQQASAYLMGLEAEWFWVVGDDAIINPALDETTLPDAVGCGIDADAVLCRPVVSNDRWLTRIAGSVGEANRSLEKAVPGHAGRSSGFHFPVDDGAMENRTITVGCADFFGLSKPCLERALPLWRRCFRQRIYVEMALPNSLLATSACPVFFENFSWVRQSELEEGVDPLREFREDTGCVFVHPVKLSVVPEHDVTALRNAGIPRAAGALRNGSAGLAD